jgi:hypothetical protein
VPQDIVEFDQLSDAEVADLSRALAAPVPQDAHRPYTDLRRYADTPQGKSAQIEFLRAMALASAETRAKIDVILDDLKRALRRRP